MVLPWSSRKDAPGWSVPMTGFFFEGRQRGILPAQCVRTPSSGFSTHTMSKQTSPQRNRGGRPQQRGTVRRQPVKQRSFDRTGDVTFAFPFDRTTLVVLVVGLIVIAVGYLLLASSMTDDPANNQGLWDNASSVTWAPVLLGLGYCVVVPYALGRRRRLAQQTTES